MKTRATLTILSLLIVGGILTPALSASASTPRRGEFCAKAKLGTHSGSLICKKVGKYNRWE